MAQRMAQLATTTSSGKKAALGKAITDDWNKLPPYAFGKKTKIVDKMEDVFEERLTGEKDEHGDLMKKKVIVGQKPTGEKIEKVMPDGDKKNAWVKKYMVGENKEMEKLFQRYGMDYGDVEKKVLGTSADAAVAKTPIEFKKATNAFIAKLKKSDSGTLAKTWSNIFRNPYGSNLEMAKIITKGISQTNSKLVSSLLPHWDGETINNFKNIYKTELKDLGPEGADILKRLEKTLDIFETYEGWSPTSSEASKT